MRKIGLAVFLFAGMLLFTALAVMPTQKVSGQEEGTPVFLPIVSQSDELVEEVDASGRRWWWWRRKPAPTPVAPPATATPVPGVPATATPGVPATAAPGATATPVAPPPGDHDHNSMVWHAPGKHGNTTAHEHGDAPPQWVVDFNGGVPEFHHVAGTPNENNHDVSWWKHTSFKGWAGQFHNVNWYGIFHLDFNPSGHPSRFHSYQIWLQDTTGAVSHMHGWLDFGTGSNTGPQLVSTCGNDSGIRPIMKVNTNNCPANQITFENWYARAAGSGGWAPDFGFNINSNYREGGDPADLATWSAIGGIKNLDRRIEFGWYANRTTLRGEFWTTQFGEVVSGPNDPACGTTVTTGSKTYTRVCLQQYIANTLPSIDFPGNSVQRTFPGSGIVELPN